MVNATSLLSLINRLEESTWNYYAMPDTIKPLQKPFVTKKGIISFINDYFDKGGKRLITEKFEVDNFGIDRAEHTVSIFFLGVLLYHNTACKNKIFYHGQVNERSEFFAFIWFITCLAHDFTFYREKDTELHISMPDIDALIAQQHISHNLLEQAVPYVPEDMFRYIRPYFNLRHAGKVTDHGILAGMIAYDILVKNRQYHYNQRNVEWLWEDYLDAEYAYAAATIAIHNIWLPDKDRFDEYKKFGLDGLIGRDKIKFGEAPLLYLLGLVDTLDPVKAYRREDIDRDNPTPAAFILRNVKIKFLSDTQFELTVSPKFAPAVLHSQGKKAEQWLALKASPIKKGIRIELFL